jgi:hypothetical protein
MSPPNGLRTVADPQGQSDAQIGGPRVTVAVSGDLDDIGSAVDAAVFRTAQESVVDSLRHANNANNTPRSETRSRVRYPGMRERVKLLGDRLQAGPRSGGDCAGTASIPWKWPLR